MKKFKVTRERAILGGLLASAGLGLLLDQTVFATGSDRSDAAADSAAIALPTLTHQSTPITPERMIADRLTQLASTISDAPPRDLFCGSDGQSGSTSRAGARVTSLDGRTLNGVLAGSDGKGVAIIDGRLLPVGTRVGKLRLVRVTSTFAVFSDGVSETILRLNEKKTPDSINPTVSTAR